MSAGMPARNSTDVASSASQKVIWGSSPAEVPGVITQADDPAMIEQADAATAATADWRVSWSPLARKWLSLWRLAWQRWFSVIWSR